MKVNEGMWGSCRNVENPLRHSLTIQKRWLLYFVTSRTSDQNRSDSILR